MARLTCVLFIFRLNNQQGGDKIDQYQSRSPDQDSSTDFDDIDLDNKSFDDDDEDEKIDIERDDEHDVTSPLSLPAHTPPQISPT